MIPVLKSVNPATISFVQAVLKEAQIDCFVMDQHASIIDGSIGAIPRRIMVINEDAPAAIRALELAGLEDEIFRA